LKNPQNLSRIRIENNLTTIDQDRIDINKTEDQDQLGNKDLNKDNNK
jgi:hypothetical protein